MLGKIIADVDAFVWGPVMLVLLDEHLSFSSVQPFRAYMKCFTDQGNCSVGGGAFSFFKLPHVIFTQPNSGCKFVLSFP